MSQPVSEEASKSAEPQAAQGTRAPFGSWLRHQREARSVSLREIADTLETVVADDLWPLPKYRELLFQY